MKTIRVDHRLVLVRIVANDGVRVSIAPVRDMGANLGPIVGGSFMRKAWAMRRNYTMLVSAFNERVVGQPI